MQTNFSLTQLADSDTAAAEQALRACVHCGFCLSACPTYTLLGDELDSPRGRIYLIKDMLEGDRTPSARVVTHLDRCLACLSCQKACPSEVNYGHLIDHARAHINRTYRRPWPQRMIRQVLNWALPRPKVMRWPLLLAKLARPVAALMPWRLRQMRTLVGVGKAAKPLKPGAVFKPQGEPRGRVALLAGCVQQPTAPQIHQATLRLLTRLGIEVVIPYGMGCCGAMPLHAGDSDSARAMMVANIASIADIANVDGGTVDAILTNTSGCGTVLKNYGHHLRDEDAVAAAAFAGKVRDVVEYLPEIGVAPAGPVPQLKVAYQSPCSMQHGQGLHEPPRMLLEALGFNAFHIGETHMCCGSAGTYNILQPDLAERLKRRKLLNIFALKPDVIATGNVGCMLQLQTGTAIPIVHTVELLDWATGGPQPDKIELINPRFRREGRKTA